MTRVPSYFLLSFTFYYRSVLHDRELSHILLYSTFSSFELERDMLVYLKIIFMTMRVVTFSTFCCWFAKPVN
jgi:hypothetical protein